MPVQKVPVPTAGGMRSEPSNRTSDGGDQVQEPARDGIGDSGAVDAEVRAEEVLLVEPFGERSTGDQPHRGRHGLAVG